jgi:hypothetical protein
MQRPSAVHHDGPMLDSVRGCQGCNDYNSVQVEVFVASQGRSKTVRAGTPSISIQILWAPQIGQGFDTCLSRLQAGSKSEDIYVSNLDEV